MNIILPAAGAGSRFAQAGYSVPKPFIPIHGRPMIAWAMDNVEVPSAKFILLLRAEHLRYVENTELAERSDVAIIPVARLTEGAACTVMLARSFIESSEPVIVANSDQYCFYNRVAWQTLIASGVDGAIWTFPSQENKWSYARSENGQVVEIAEKRVISPEATVGVYHWSSGHLLCKGVDAMITNNRRVNGEFYLAPSYNEIVSDHNIQTFQVEKMLGLGTPEDFEINHNSVMTLS